MFERSSGSQSPNSPFSGEGRGTFASLLAIVYMKDNIVAKVLDRLPMKKTG